MQIPREFYTELLSYIGSELTEQDPAPSATALAEKCGVFCRRWFGMSELNVPPLGWDVTGLESYARRLGKLLGDFHNQEGG